MRLLLAFRAVGLVLLLFIWPHCSEAQLSLSLARYYLAATSVDNLAVFAGGAFNLTGGPNDFGLPSSVVDIFNGSSETWTTAELSQARFLLASTTVSNLAFFAGGYSTRDGQTSSTVMDIFNASSNSWTTTTLSQARGSLAAASVGSLALFAGGRSSTQNLSQPTVDIFNTSSNTWTTATLSEARWAIAAASVSDLVLFGGGTNNSAIGSSAVDIFNASSNSWTVASLSQARHWPAATSVGSLAIFAGGTAGGSFSSVVDIYNASSNSWTVATLSEARVALTATSGHNIAFFAGGVNDSGMASCTVDIYNVSSNTWTATTLSHGHESSAGASVSSMALFAGGISGSELTAAVDVVLLPSPSPSLQPTPLPSQSTTPSPSVAPVPAVPVVAKFNLTTPALAVTPLSADATQQVDLGLVSLEELAPDNTTVQYIDLYAAGWSGEQHKNDNDTTSFVFISHLGTATSGANNASVLYRFSTFAYDTPITTESNYSFVVTPAWVKFTLNITSWTWKSPSGKLRLTIKINPSFLTAVRWQDTPQAGMTTFLLSASDTNANPAQLSTMVRLLDFAEVGGSTRVVVKAAAVTNSSSISLTFDHFNETLSFDPDFGLLLGSDAGRGNAGGSDNSAVIIGVSVAIPVALVCIMVVIGVVLAVLIYKRRAERKTIKRAIKATSEV